MAHEINHIAQVIGYAVLIYTFVVGLVWSFVGVANLTYKTLRACKYTHDFWDELFNALWNRWYQKARKREEQEGRDGA